MLKTHCRRGTDFKTWSTDQRDQVLEGSAQSIQFSDHLGIAGTNI
jgi:hypothetical protein